MKTASRILGTAFFLSGYEVQDAPRYGAERRGAPMFAYVRADRNPIFERGIIHCPDLVVVADDSLLRLAAAGVSVGLDEHTVMLIHSKLTFEQLRNQCPVPDSLLVLAPVRQQGSGGIQPLSTVCGAAAAALVDIDEAILLEAVSSELSALEAQRLSENLELAGEVYRKMAAHGVSISPGNRETELGMPDWIELPFEEACLSAPVIHGRATSRKMDTGAWRSLRPQIDFKRCNRCGLCATFCPDGVISLDEQGLPEIDYGHCKGCLVCLVQCPAHAISAVVEQPLATQEKQP
jgi:pyruvate ferredoxin oxidoreductase gamma subunit